MLFDGHVLDETMIVNEERTGLRVFPELLIFG
jgi:hypothetical protein